MELMPLDSNLALFTLRLALGVIFLTHGFIELLTPQKIASEINLSASGITFTGVIKILGALSITIGIVPRLGSFLLMGIMLHAIHEKTRKHENTFTGPSGWQLEFILLAAILAIFLSGAGALTAF